MKAHRVGVVEETALDGYHYASSFAVGIRSGDTRSSEQWVRSMFENASAPVQTFVLFGWKNLLQLRLGPKSSSDYVLGWKVTSTTPEVIVLDVQSPLLQVRKVLRVEASRVVTTTCVRYDLWAARVIWAMVAPVHHRTEPFLLGRAGSLA